MTMGQTAYFGPAIDSLGHFARLGYTPVGLFNPADFLAEVSFFPGIFFHSVMTLCYAVEYQGTLQ